MAPCLALAVVLGTAMAGNGDYVAVVREGGMAVGSCAKSLDACEDFRTAIRAGWFPAIPVNTPTRCEPRANCFSPQSNVIRGYNDK